MKKTNILRLLSTLFTCVGVLMMVSCSDNEAEDGDDPDKGIVTIPYNPGEKGFRPADKEELEDLLYVIFSPEDASSRVTFKQTYNGVGTRYRQAEFSMNIVIPKPEIEFYTIDDFDKIWPKEDWVVTLKSYCDIKEDKELRSFNADHSEANGLEVATVRTYKADISVKADRPESNVNFSISLDVLMNIKTPSGNVISTPIDEDVVFQYPRVGDLDITINEDDPESPYADLSFKVDVFVVGEKPVSVGFVKRFTLKK